MVLAKTRISCSVCIFSITTPHEHTPPHTTPRSARVPPPRARATPTWRQRLQEEGQLLDAADGAEVGLLLVRGQAAGRRLRPSHLPGRDQLQQRPVERQLLQVQSNHRLTGRGGVRDQSPTDGERGCQRSITDFEGGCHTALDFPKSRSPCRVGTASYHPSVQFLVYARIKSTILNEPRTILIAA